MNNSNQNLKFSITQPIPNYQISEILYSGSRTIVYRAIRSLDQQPVVIKALKREYPTFSELLQFRNQYAITKNLHSPLIIQTYNLEPYCNSYVLVMEDFQGISLQEWIRKRKKTPSLVEFLEIAINLCNTLNVLYQERIIHKDIKPANILINPETKQIKLIDFSIASLLPRETQEIQNANSLEGTLAYISPEQTGRMNRGIDYRTDFYSLGITFYELLTGALPFQANDPMELIHSHIAKLAPVVHEIKPEIPLVLSAIVMKLMAKNAEDRYQSALGLKFDLEKCLTQLQETGKIESFEIGQQDVSDRFLIPDKLYGRETEVETLLQAFERVSLGATEMMLVAGFSGIGKTAVVNEVHKPIVRQRGYFIKGKFDQFNRDIPLSAFVQAFRGLMGQLLSESDASLQLWKQKILTAVGDSGQIIIEVIPELELVIGCQPPVPELSGTAAQNRFNFLFQKFIQVFTTIEHPLVMFIDDLQWADLASLNLIQVLMAESNTGYLLLLGAYRDNEVLAGHPLMLTLDAIAEGRRSAIDQAGAKVNTITLEPLSQSSLNQLIADTLHCAMPLAQPLTELVIQKTQGNPFFTTQFLKALHQEKLINFDTNAGYWQCDIVRVWDTTLTDDVAEFMALQLQKLPDTTQNILKLAACIGAQFDLQTLAIISEQSPTEVATALWKALQEGFILPQSEIYKFYLEETELDRTVNHKLLNYKFLHDRIQQAAYSLITHEQKQLTHLGIGQLLLQNTPVEQIENYLFEIVNHLNKGVDLIVDQAKQLELAHLNLIAGNKAKSATAYDTALKYFTFGIELLPTGHWQNQYNLTLDLYIAATEAAYLSTNFAEIEQFAQEVIQNSRSLIDQIKVYQIKILASSAQNQLQQSVETGLGILDLLGVNFPEQPNQADIQQELAGVSANLSQIEIEDLINLPVMEDSQALAAMEILSTIAPAVFRIIPTLYPLIVFKQVNLSITHGNGPLSAFAYVGYGLILCSALQDIDTGYQFGQLANHLLIKSNIKKLTTKVNSINGGYIIHWKQHLKTVLPILQEGYKNGLEMGELEFTSYSAFFYGSILYYTGHDLEQTKNDLANYSAVIYDLKQENPLCWNGIYHQTVLNLLGQSIDVCRLQGDACDEDKLIPLLLESGDKLGLHLFYSNKLILSYLFENYSLALDHANQAELYLDGVLGMFAVPVFYFYDSLVHLAAASTISTLKISPQDAWLPQVTQNQAKLKEWAIYAPMNFLHKYDLVEAERHRLLDEKVLAIDFYDRAISGAKANEYIQEEALANELAAKFYLAWGKQRIAQDYMIEAYYGYARWGAKAKVADLEKRYPQLLAPILQNSSSLSANETTFALKSNTSSSSATPQGSSILRALDLAAIVQVSQALSGEIQMEKLLVLLLSIIIENAGADKCIFILLQDEHLLIEGSITEGAEPLVLQGIPIEESEEIPLKLIYKVQHNKQTVVLVNASNDPTLANDPYIIRYQPRSILCSPILHQGKLLGILYLENNLAIGAFTNDRVELLNLICAQAAISLENARLYEQSQNHAKELEQSLEKLRYSEARFQKLTDNIPGVIFQLRVAADGSASIPYMSSGCYQLYEVTAEEMMAGVKNPRAMEYPDDSFGIEQAMMNSAETLMPFTYEWRIITPSGIIKWVQAASHPERHIDGSIVWDGFIMDISDRKHIEAEQTRLLGILESTSDLIGTSDPNGNTLYLNRAWRELLNIEDKSSIKEIKISQYHPNWALEIIGNQGIPEAIRSGSWAGETAVLDQEGGEIPVSQVVIAHKSSDDELQYFSTILRDISDVKQAELALQQKSFLLQQTLTDLQNTQLQMVQSEKMSALGNLVAGIAHEMNNPLGFIAASLKQAKPTFMDIIEHLKLYQSSFPNQNEKILDHAEEIDLEYSLEDVPKIINSMEIACDRLHNISTSLRTFSRADTDQKVDFHLHEGIDSTILILKHRLKANDQHPEIEVITEYGNIPQIECFPGQLNQVFMNILANAIDILEESNIGRSFAEITANPNKITITTTVIDRYVQISIIDNGMGMSEEVKNKAFDHLFTTKEVGKGTGLGLAIAKQIIEEKHGGHIQVNSTLGKGTEFIITLPLRAT